LEVGAAAVTAMGVERKSEWDVTSVEAGATLLAPPGHNAHATEQIVEQSPPLRAAGSYGMTDWASNMQGLRFDCGKHRTTAG
jgi:hypothetical protein